MERTAQRLGVGTIVIAAFGLVIGCSGAGDVGGNSVASAGDTGGAESEGDEEPSGGQGVDAGSAGGEEATESSEDVGYGSQDDDASTSESEADGEDETDAGPSVDNLLANPSFETTGSGACPSDWTCITHNPSDSGQFSTIETDPYRGERAVQWSGEEEPITVVKQTLDSEPGKKYDVSVWVRGSELSSEPVLQVLFDGDGELLDNEKFRADEEVGDWTKISATTTPAPVGTDELRFNLSTNGTSGTVAWDAASMVDVTGPDDEPTDPEPEPEEFEVIEAQGQTVTLSDGEVYENKLIDFTTGGDFSINTRNATNWTIRNIGFKGRKQTSGTLFGVSDSGGGTSVIENVYLGDGSGRNGGQATCNSTSNCTHGPVGIFVGPEHSGHLDLRNINVQGWPNNGIYGSAPGSNSNGQDGTIHIDTSYGANNYVSSFRIAGSNGNLITNSVAYNDGNDYNGRPIWVWKPGPVVLENVDLAEGGYSYALVAGSYNGGTVINLRDSEIQGSIQRRSGSTVNETNVGSNPDLSVPDGVPTTPEEAASGQ